MPGIATRAIHGDGPRIAGALNTPIVHSTTYRYPEAEGGAPATHIYTRYDNPTTEALEAKLASLDGGDTALVFASGMAAISAVCQSFLRPGDGIAVMAGAYGGTMAYMDGTVRPGGMEVHVIDAMAAPAVPEGCRLVWLESISNPLLRVPDIEAWAEAAHAAGALLVVDATFASPVIQRPLGLGADIVVHSATKYLNGHSDVTAGVLVTRKELRERLWTTRRDHGAVLDPLAGSLVERGLKTLAVRVRAQSASALALAEAFEAAGVRTLYPMLPSHPDHARAQHLGLGGGVLSIDLGSTEAAQAFRRRLRVALPAASLGGVETLVSLPVETSHAYAPADERRAAGIGDGLVRISVGLEDLEDLEADLLGALRD